MGIVWFSRMCTRNHMIERLERTLGTRNIHVVYFHSSVMAACMEEEALTMFTSNEYEEESGLFLYNAT